MLASLIASTFTGHYTYSFLPFLLPTPLVLALLPSHWTADAESPFLTPQQLNAAGIDVPTAPEGYSWVCIEAGKQIKTGMNAPGGRSTFFEAKLEIPFFRHPSSSPSASPTPYTFKQTLLFSTSLMATSSHYFTGLRSQKTAFKVDNDGVYEASGWMRIKEGSVAEARGEGWTEQAVTKVVGGWWVGERTGGVATRFLATPSSPASPSSFSLQLHLPSFAKCSLEHVRELLGPYGVQKLDEEGWLALGVEGWKLDEEVKMGVGKVGMPLRRSSSRRSLLDMTRRHQMYIPELGSGSRAASARQGPGNERAGARATATAHRAEERFWTRLSELERQLYPGQQPRIHPEYINGDPDQLFLGFVPIGGVPLPGATARRVVDQASQWVAQLLDSWVPHPNQITEREMRHIAALMDELLLEARASEFARQQAADLYGSGGMDYGHANMAVALIDGVHILQPAFLRLDDAHTRHHAPPPPPPDHHHDDHGYDYQQPPPGSGYYQYPQGGGYFSLGHPQSKHEDRKNVYLPARRAGRVSVVTTTAAAAQAQDSEST